MTGPSVVSMLAGEIASVIPSREYNRLLGMPRERALEGELAARAKWAREWYSNGGRPYVAVRRFALQDIAGVSVFLAGGIEFRSAVLADRLRHGHAHALVALAATAGREVAEEVTRLWSAEHPDEAFFLDRFAVAVTEFLVNATAAALCRDSEPEQETFLPHLSPGCGHWDLSDQHRLMAALLGSPVQPSENVTLGPLTLLPSGALHPQHSILAAMGVSRRPGITTPEQLCRSCDYKPCVYRRAPYSL